MNRLDREQEFRQFAGLALSGIIAQYSCKDMDQNVADAIKAAQKLQDKLDAYFTPTVVNAAVIK